MIKIKAYIRLYKKGRKTPFLSGYRPLFNFVAEMRVSGKIKLLDKDEFHPGDEGVVEISFLNRDYLGDDFEKGKTFTFGESEESLGEGVISEILQ